MTQADRRDVFVCPWCQRYCFNVWHWFKLLIAGYSRLSSCWLGMHRWDMPGGCCEKCGKRDRFFAQTKSGRAEPERLMKWGRQAAREVAYMLDARRETREKLLDSGWVQCGLPCRVNNEPTWFHDELGYWTESEAVKWVD